MIRSLALLISTAGLAGCAVQPLTTDGKTPAAERQILLTVPQAGAAATALVGAPNRYYLRRGGYGPTPSVERTLNQLAREYGLVRVDGWPIPSLDVYCEVFEIAAEASVDSVVAGLANDPRIDLVQPMNTFDTLSSRYDDPYEDLQPSVAQLELEQAHTLATGKSVDIVVVDTAVDALHPELRGHISVNRDLVDGGRPPRRGEVHGTAIAGVIGSAANNAEGIVGVAPDVRIAVLRACWSTGPNSAASRCTSFTLAQALEMAIRLEPRIVNLSLAGPNDPLLAELLDEVIARGIIVVAAEPASPSAHNDFPSSHPGVIAAGSAQSRGLRAGGYVLAAPASEVLTTTPGSGYAFLSGNSLAAAHVSGVIALLLEADPSLGADAAVALLSATSVSFEGRRSINACRALEQLEGRHAAVSRPAGPGAGTLECESVSINAARLLGHPAAASPVTASSR